MALIEAWRNQFDLQSPAAEVRSPKSDRQSPIAEDRPLKAAKIRRRSPAIRPPKEDAVDRRSPAAGVLVSGRQSPAVRLNTTYSLKVGQLFSVYFILL